MSNAEGLYRMDASAASRAAEIPLGACDQTDDDNEEIFQLAELMRHHGRIVDLVDEMIKEAREAGKTEGQNEQRRDQGSV